MTNRHYYYNITIRKFKPSKSVIESWRKVETEVGESHADTERFARCDAMWNDECRLGEVGGGGGAMESKDIAQRVREKLKEWVNFRHYKDYDDDGNWKHRAKLVPLPAITRKTLYFRCDFPEILDRNGVFRILAELKGAKKDSTGGLWKK